MNGQILWIRHGLCRDGLCRPRAHARPDSPLTIRGILQVLAKARELRDRDLRPNLVLTSPLPRALMSAKILAEVLQSPLAAPTSLFAEWRAPDCVLGVDAESYPSEYREWREQRFRNPETALPGGESLTALMRRARSALSLAQEEAGRHGPTLIVSHRVLIGAIAAVTLGVTSPQETFSAASSFSLEPATVWPAQPTPTAGLPRWTR
jgi:broad specificity phosphatase PhoE